MPPTLSGSLHQDSQNLGLDPERLARAGWSAALADTAAAIAVLDAAGTIRAANAGFATALGRKNSAPGSLTEAFPEAIAGEIAAALAAAASTDAPVTVPAVIGGVARSVSITRADDSGTHFIAQWSNATGRGPAAGSTPDIEGLTAREHDVLRLIGYGLSTADIARVLHRSVKTIEWHRVSLGNKLGVTNRVELARIAIAAGLSGLGPLPEGIPSDHPSTNARTNTTNGTSNGTTTPVAAENPRVHKSA